MEISQCYPSTRHSSPSPDGELVATVQGSHLVVRALKDGGMVHIFPLKNNAGAKYKFLQWFPSRQHRHTVNGANARIERPTSQRFLVAKDNEVYVYNMQDHQWHAELSGGSSHIGNIADVDFGWTHDEIMILSDFGLKMTLWSLRSGRGVEIRDPKSLSRCYSLRPQTGHLAIITRPTTQDVVMVLTPFSHELERKFTFATVDAQGLKWSPDGKWLATWEAASAGFALYVYTPDGHLFKTYTGDQNIENPGLGISIVEWDPSGKYLAIGAHENRVTLLHNQTFKLAATLHQTPIISTSNVPIWQEQINSSGERSYSLAPQSACPPTSSDETGKLAAISHLAFNLDGTCLASRSELNPSTVWIWYLHSLTLMTVLIHHHPVKSLQWHPAQPDLLLVHCSTEDPVLHLIGSDWLTPQILKIPLDKPGGRTEATWISPPLPPSTQTSSTVTTYADTQNPHSISTSSSSSSPPLRLLFGNARNHTICRILRTGETPEEQLTPRPPQSRVLATSLFSSTTGPEDRFDEGNSMDLSPVKLSTDHFTRVIGGRGTIPAAEEEATWDGEMDDTFGFRQSRGE